MIDEKLARTEKRNEIDREPKLITTIDITLAKKYGFSNLSLLVSLHLYSGFWRLSSAFVLVVLPGSAARRQPESVGRRGPPRRQTTRTPRGQWLKRQGQID